MIIIGDKMDVCKWYKCEIGFRYHHTLEEWDTHVGYAKIDIPRIEEETSSVPEEYINETATSTSVVQASKQIIVEEKLKIAGVALIAVWGIVLFLALRSMV